MSENVSRRATALTTPSMKTKKWSDKKRMMRTKVTKEFAQAEVSRMKREATVRSRMVSAFADFSTLRLEDDWDLNTLSNPDLSSIYFTRISLQSSIHVERSSKAVQTDPQLYTEVPVRIKSTKSESGTLIEPRYLEAMSQLMSENMSASEAIKAVHIIDTKVWGQTRHLPLELDKQYTKSLSKLKKLQGHADAALTFILETSPDSIVTDITDCSQPALVICEQHKEMTEVTSEIQPNAEIGKLKRIVEEKIKIRRKDPNNTLPVPASVRRNHNLMAVYCEGQIANELIQKTGYLMPDSTSRQGVGEIAATVTKVGDKIRALKAVPITKGTRENWASAIIYMVGRLATALFSNIDNVWMSLSSILSDLCKVNKNLSVEIQKMIGSTWQPGQLFCNLHFTLAVPDVIKTVMTEYQSYIGGAKLFPKTVGFGMNPEGTLIII